MNDPRPAHTPPAWTHGYVSTSVPVWRRHPLRFLFASLSLNALALALWASSGSSDANPWYRLLAPPGEAVVSVFCDHEWYDRRLCIEDRYDTDKEALEATAPPSHIAQAICDVGRCDPWIDPDGPWVTACAHVSGHDWRFPPPDPNALITSDDHEYAAITAADSELRALDAKRRREGHTEYYGSPLPPLRAACAPSLAIHERIMERHRELLGIDGRAAWNAQRLLLHQGE